MNFLTEHKQPHRLAQTFTNAILGFAIGDAMGVPYEAKKRGSYHAKKKMEGYGTYNLPPGTWSDDTSLTLATIASIAKCKEINPKDMMEHFAQWLFSGTYSADGNIFDVSTSTRIAISSYEKSGQFSPSKLDNGSGALMRMLPLAFMDASDAEIQSVAHITHADPTSTAICQLYVAIAKRLIAGEAKKTAILNACQEYSNDMISTDRLDNGLQRNLNSDGYVVSTLEAALWCLLHGTTYKDTIMLAINLGGETGSIAALAGGLAGICYETNWRKNIPVKWQLTLRNRQVLKSTCKKMWAVLKQPTHQ